MYFGIHNHTEYSNLRLIDCNIKVDRLIDKAIELGLKGIAITDHECISSHIGAIQKIKQLKDKGVDFNLALGNEIYLVDSLEDVKDDYQSGVTKFPHFVLVAKNKRGHEALRKLSSQAWLNSFRTGKMERVVTETQYFSQIVQEYKGCLIGSSACLGSTLGIKFNQYRETNDIKYIQEIEHFVSACKFLFEDDFYLELQPSFNEQQIEYNKFLIELGIKMNVKVIYSTDTHFLTLNHKQLHKSFLQSKEGDREVDDFYGTTYLMSKDEIWDYFKHYISEEYFEWMTNNTLEISNKIEFYDLQHTTIVPQINIPPFNDKHIMEQYLDKYEYIKKYYTSPHGIDRYLLFSLKEGMLKQRQRFNDENLSRVDSELKELWLISENLQSRLASYYLLVQDLIDIMWTVSLIGIARGSTTGFYCSYLLGISQMNPIKFNLPSWRHISAERPLLLRVFIIAIL